MRVHHSSRGIPPGFHGYYTISLSPSSAGRATRGFHIFYHTLLRHILSSGIIPYIRRLYTTAPCIPRQAIASPLHRLCDTTQPSVRALCHCFQRFAAVYPYLYLYLSVPRSLARSLHTYVHCNSRVTQERVLLEPRHIIVPYLYDCI